MTDRRTLATLALAVLILLAPVGVVVAQTLTHQSTAGVTYQTNSGVTVTLGDDREVAASPFADDQTYADGTLRVSGSDASVEVTDATYGSDPVTIRSIDADPGSVTVERTDLDRSITIESGDASTLQLRDYALDNGADDMAYASDNGLTVTFDGLQTGVSVAAVDAATGEPLSTATTGSTGAATFELPAGQREVRIEGTPSDLEVRNEVNPDELIDENVTLTARLFAGGDTVVERPVTNGTVSLAGVPLDEELVVTVREENADYTYRRILLESAIQTSEIYLLPTTEPSAEVRFQLRDDTGRFEGPDTRIFIEKPITRDNSTEYRVITGDRVGADGEFPTILVDSQRYRIRVENDAGEQRVLGAYTVQGAQVSTLPIGQVEFTGDVDGDPVLQTNLRAAPEGASHDHEVRLTYLDPEGETDSIDVSITNSSGGAIRPATTEEITGTEAYVETYPIEQPFDPEQDTATVTVDATRATGPLTLEEVLGDVPDVPTGPLSPQLVELLGIVSIVAVVGLLVIKSPAMAALVGPGYAGLLVVVGVVPIPMAGVVLAGLVGVLAVVGTNTRL